eukprot:gnl/MRDRNA2_/MRDRNA2_135297_c0_seq1.p1 gnl/MRDRNA2_/MRDRNA2_135297_c0~~gnl/MRDRNA2_/MRDRNA2_135297_c0_seq1.p1  ORF type:complete len:519 (-),score=77.92 gnl/MRDRNA2_/MRDRNA2_135297_c0_seq1:434-1990(-)
MAPAEESIAAARAAAKAALHTARQGSSDFSVSLNASVGSRLCKAMSVLPSSVNAVPRPKSHEAMAEAACSQRMPAVFSSITEKWEACSWSLESLTQRFGENRVRVGMDSDCRPLTAPLRDFAAYVKRDSDGDVAPLYVFEPRLRAPLTLEYDPTIGGLFPDDLLSLVGSDRPPYRWLCLGPSRSGSTVHIDPLGTAAWNALLVGRKRWALLDSDLPRAEVEAPGLTPLEWFHERLPRLREKYPSKVYEAVLEPGEVMYVPAGMWHAVLNLEFTVAVTHNFVGPGNFDASWRAARDERFGLAREWLRWLDVQNQPLAKRAQELNALDLVPMSVPPPLSSFKKKQQMPVSVAKEDRDSSTPGASMLWRRLEGDKHLHLEGLGLRTWKEATRRDMGPWQEPVEGQHPGLWKARYSCKAGEFMFAERALVTAYEDEAARGTGELLTFAAKRLPPAQQSLPLLSSWVMDCGQKVLLALLIVWYHVATRVIWPSRHSRMHAQRWTRLGLESCNRDKPYWCCVRF